MRGLRETFTEGELLYLEGGQRLGQVSQRCLQISILGDARNRLGTPVAARARAASQGAFQLQQFLGSMLLWYATDISELRSRQTTPVGEVGWGILTTEWVSLLIFYIWY